MHPPSSPWAAGVWVRPAPGPPLAAYFPPALCPHSTRSLLKVLPSHQQQVSPGLPWLLQILVPLPATSIAPTGPWTTFITAHFSHQVDCDWEKCSWNRNTVGGGGTYSPCPREAPFCGHSPRTESKVNPTPLGLR